MRNSRKWFVALALLALMIGAAYAATASPASATAELAVVVNNNVATAQIQITTVWCGAVNVNVAVNNSLVNGKVLAPEVPMAVADTNKMTNQTNSLDNLAATNIETTTGLPGSMTIVDSNLATTGNAFLSEPLANNLAAPNANKTAATNYNAMTNNYATALGGTTLKLPNQTQIHTATS